MKEQIRAYISQQLSNDPKYVFTDEEPLISGGWVDSFDLTKLAVFIEEKFGVHFADPELTVDNMDTLNQIVRNIEAKLAK